MLSFAGRGGAFAALTRATSRAVGNNGEIMEPVIVGLPTGDQHHYSQKRHNDSEKHDGIQHHYTQRYEVTHEHVLPLPVPKNSYTMTQYLPTRRPSITSGIGGIYWITMNAEDDWSQY